MNNIWQITEDALVCLGAAHWELVQRRCELLKSQLAKDYTHLYAQKVLFTDKIIGNNITKQIKDITDDNKVTHKLLDQKYGWKHGLKGSSQGNYTSRGQNANRAIFGYGKGRFTPYKKLFFRPVQLLPLKLFQRKDSNEDDNQKGIKMQVNIIAGRIQHYFSIWKSITTDSNILDNQNAPVSIPYDQPIPTKG